MTYEASHAGRSSASDGGAAMLPMLGGALLTLIWGAYTLLFVVEILSMPMPAYPG